MNIYPIEIQFGDDRIFILFTFIDLEYFKSQLPVRSISIVRTEDTNIEILKVPGVLQVQNGVWLTLIVHLQLLDTGIVLPHHLILYIPVQNLNGGDAGTIPRELIFQILTDTQSINSFCPYSLVVKVVSVPCLISHISYGGKVARCIDGKNLASTIPTACGTIKLLIQNIILQNPKSTLIARIHTVVQRFELCLTFISKG